MFVAIGSALLGLVGRKDGTTAKLQSAVGIAALIGFAVIAFLIWLAVHDSNVRDEALDEQDAVVNAAVIGADRSATAAQDKRDKEFADSQAGIKNSVSNAVAADPAGAKKPVGPASRAYYEELRRQQEERKAQRR